MPKIAIVVSEFNSEITSVMLNECLRGLKEQKIQPIVVKVPGAAEIPYALQELVYKKKIKGAVALGLVLKGDTDHYEKVCDMCAVGILNVSLKHRIPIVFEVLMCDKLRKANKRIGKAYEAAYTLTKMLNLKI